jgi:DNA-damage-inducible protein D
MKKELIQKLHKSFEECAHQTDEGIEFWLARELQELLGYTEWRNFTLVIEKAKIACQNSGQLVSDHFVDVNKMIGLAKGAERVVGDIALTRYACYLIAQNGDPRATVKCCVRDPVIRRLLLHSLTPLQHHHGSHW